MTLPHSGASDSPLRFPRSCLSDRSWCLTRDSVPVPRLCHAKMARAESADPTTSCAAVAGGILNNWPCGLGPHITVTIARCGGYFAPAARAHPVCNPPCRPSLISVMQVMPGGHTLNRIGQNGSHGGVGAGQGAKLWDQPLGPPVLAVVFRCSAGRPGRLPAGMPARASGLGCRVALPRGVTARLALALAL
jgi:hypothetical protein